MSKRITTTLRLPEEELRLLKAIAGYENRSLTEIFQEMGREYIQQHRETMELIGIPGFVAECREGLAEIQAGGGVDLSDLAD